LDRRISKRLEIRVESGENLGGLWGLWPRLGVGDMVENERATYLSWLIKVFG
jgi:hypothetical protein